MIVWITHAKVGHRQTPIKQKAQPCVGLSALWDLICDLLEFTTTRAKGTCCGGDSYRLHRCDVETKVGHRQTPIKQKAQPCVGLFALWDLICDLLEALTTRAQGALRHTQDRLVAAEANDLPIRF